MMLPLNGHGDRPAPHSPLGHVEEWESSAIDFLEARLSQLESSAITEHLAACRSCREKLAEQKWMIQVLGAVEPAEVPRDVESAVFDRLFPASGPLSPPHSAEPGVIRRLFAGAARRPWVPAAIAAVAVMVALAGSGDVIRSGGGADTARSDLSAPTPAGETTTASNQAETLTSSPPSSTGASLPETKSYDDAGNSVAALDAPGTDTTAAGATQTTAAPTDSGAQEASATTIVTATTATTDSTSVSDDGPASYSARTLAPTVWANAEVAVGDVDAAAVIEKITGLREPAMQSASGAPIYAAMVRRSDIDAVLRQLGDGGLAVNVSDVPQSPLDPASAQEVQGISELPYLEPVSPQGDTLSLSIESQAPDAEDEFVRLVLSTVR